MMFEEFTDENGSVVRYHVVTDETAGEYVLTTSTQTQRVNAGQVLVETYRPGVYDVVNSIEEMNVPAASVPEDNFVIGDTSAADTEE